MSLNDELFAIRLSLQDSYSDESIIIRELKIHLRNINTPTDQINQTLIDFYKHFNINFPDDFISGINIDTPILPPLPHAFPPLPQTLPQPPQSASSLSQTIASLLLGINQQIVDIENEVDSDDEDSDDDSDEDSDDDSDDDSDEDSDDDLPELEDVSGSAPLADLSGGNLNMIFNMFANGSSIGAPINQNINFQNPNQFLATFNNLINSINLPPPMEDVKVTLDEKDIDDIITKEAEGDIKLKCSICMMDVKKGDKISELKCKHTFHTDCIMQWLKEYNYKCPVCRKECGKAKYHI